MLFGVNVGYSLVGKLSEFWIGETRGVRVENTNVLMVRTREGLFAYQGECPHKGVALCEGRLNGDLLTCSAHGWEFNVANGRGVNPRNAELKKFPLKIEGDEIWIDADEKGKASVGPTLIANAAGHAIASAIAEQNSDVEVLDRGSYLRVEAPSPCRLSRYFLEKHMSKAVDLREELELTMSSFKGRIAIEPSQVVWRSEGGKL